MKKMVIVCYLNETSEFDLAMHVGEIDVHLLTGNEGLSYSNILSLILQGYSLITIHIH